jgi:mRNA interferase MazF
VVVTNNIYNRRVPVIQVVPITAWNEKKAKIITNVVIEPEPGNGLSKTSVADCLQTRPIDYRQRLVAVKGKLTDKQLKEIDVALKFVFDLK